MKAKLSLNKKYALFVPNLSKARLINMNHKNTLLVMQFSYLRFIRDSLSSYIVESAAGAQHTVTNEYHIERGSLKLV